MTRPRVALFPRHADGVLRAIVISRTSTVFQSDERIDASNRYMHDYLARIYQGPLDVVFLGEEAGGRKSGRATIVVVQRLIATGRFDLVIAADRSRIHRHQRRQLSFVQFASDAGTRVICLDDDFDTDRQEWN